MKDHRLEIEKILKDWLQPQGKDDIVFTDDIAINEIVDEILAIPLYPRDFVEFTSGIFFDGIRWFVTNQEPMNTNELYEFWSKNVKQ